MAWECVTQHLRTQGMCVYSAGRAGFLQSYPLLSDCCAIVVQGVSAHMRSTLGMYALFACVAASLGADKAAGRWDQPESKSTVYLLSWRLPPSTMLTACEVDNAGLACAG
jgi:hypothetical protein